MWVVGRREGGCGFEWESGVKRKMDAQGVDVFS